MRTDLGRPRKRGPDETVTLGFRVSPDLLKSLDEIAAKMTAKQPPGLTVSRTDVVRMALHRFVEAEKPSRKRRGTK